ncbi:MAG: Ig-like domain-containing protein, partial [Candidatus Poribacteria bacterium]|nr:Ig-like domain-containing protein [Candidatus Poribacteria bacterium]
MTTPNNPPVATTQSVEVGKNMPQHPITLSASDADGDSLTFLLVSNPSNGQLSGTPPNLKYDPNFNYTGNDSFTFKVNDGTVDSEPATISITVTAPNDPPVAAAQSVTTNEDTAVFFSLAGTDADSTWSALRVMFEPDVLTYTVVDQPSSGTLYGTVTGMAYTEALPSLTYTPN